MNMITRTVLASALIMVASLLQGCAATGHEAFLHTTRINNDLSAEELTQLQYYVSHEIRLQRDYTVGERRVAGGRLIIKNGQTIEEVIVRAGTPGLAIDILSDYRLEVSFEQGTSFIFSRGDDQNKYRLGAHEWNNGIGKILFEGEFYAAIEESGIAHLLIDKDALLKLDKTSRILPGMRLDDEIKYDENGFNKDGYDANGFDEDGFDWDGYDVNGFDGYGYNENGYDANGYDGNGRDVNGLDKNGN